MKNVLEICFRGKHTDQLAEYVQAINHFFREVYLLTKMPLGIWDQKQFTLYFAIRKVVFSPVHKIWRYPGLTKKEKDRHLLHSMYRETGQKTTHKSISIYLLCSSILAHIWTVTKYPNIAHHKQNRRLVVTTSTFNLLTSKIADLW